MSSFCNSFEEHYGGIDVQEEALRFEELVRKEGHNFYMDVVAIEEVFDYYQLLEESDKALKLMEFAVGQYPYMADLYYRKSALEFDCERFGQAMEDINRAVELRPYETDYLLEQARQRRNLGLYNLALESLHNALDYASEPSDVYYEIGQLYFAEGKTSQALGFLAQTLAMAPDNEDALQDVFACYEKLDKPAEALEYFQTFLDEHPYSAVAWHNLGMLYFQEGLYEKGGDAFEYAQIIQPDLLAAYHGQANCCIELEKYDEAIDALLDALARAPKDSVTLLTLGECYEYKFAYERARHYYFECTRCAPELPDAWYGVAATLEAEERYLNALNYYERAIGLEPTYYEAWAGRADCEYMLGNSYSAYEALKQAVALKSDDLTLWTDWAARLDGDDNTEGALLLLQEGLRHNPQAVELIYHLAAYYFKAGQSREAFVYLENALLVNFENHTILYSLFPRVAQLRPIQELIEQYRPRC